MASESVRVIIRCRPFNARERQLNAKNIIQINPSALQCSISCPSDVNGPGKTFTFDGVYDQGSTTEQIYTDFVYSLVEGVIEGYNATVFAYGQTGSGKSFSMQGVPSPANQVGILPRAFEHLFESISTSDNTKYLVMASYLEIYNEEIRDLLSQDTKKSLELKEHSERGVFVANLSQHSVQNVADCQRLMETGWRNRSIGATLMNADSSRSHSMFTISVEMMDLTSESSAPIRCGKLNLVDLAGSERQTKTGAMGERLKEATKINLSLSALGNVISALVDGKSKHIPYRDSKLTRLLQDSLGGNTKTLMISCISPADDNYDETLSTLRYANRAKNIQNRPRINQDAKDTLLKEYQQEIERLRKMVEHQSPQPIDIRRDEEEKRLEKERFRLRSEYEDKIQALQKDIEREQETNAKATSQLENLRRSYQDELSRMKLNSTPVAESMRANEKTEDTFKKLKEIEDHLVGGEKANDKEFKERHLKKKNQSERRMALLSQLLEKSKDEDGALGRVYDGIQEEMRIKTEVIRKYKQKLRSLERDIQDLQSEFETERCEYLDTVRRQDQQLKLLQQILSKIQPLVKKDCNYSELETILQNCLWNEEAQKWLLPDVAFHRTKLPPAGNYAAQQSNHYETVVEGTEDIYAGDRLFQKLERGEAEDLLNQYFRPNRASQILTRTNEDVHRAIRKWNELSRKLSKGPSLSHSQTTLSVSQGITDTGSLQKPTSPLPSSWSAPNSIVSSYNGWIGTSGTIPTRKPIRLESLNPNAPEPMDVKINSVKL